MHYCSATFAKKNITSGSIGFTLIELLFAITIAATMISVGAVKYVDFNRAQSIQSAGQTFKNNLRDIQAKAGSNLKPPECGVTPLTGYQVLALGWSDPTCAASANVACLKSQAYCGVAQGVISYYLLPTDIDFDNQAGTSILPDFTFKTLGTGVTFDAVGVTSETFTLRSNRTAASKSDQYFYKICVGSSGEIKDCGVKKGDDSPVTFQCTC